MENRKYRGTPRKRILNENVCQDRRAVTFCLHLYLCACPHVWASKGIPLGMFYYPTGYVLLGLFFLTFQLKTSSSEAAQPGLGGFRGNLCLP